MSNILSDHNYEGQAAAIYDALRYQGYASLYQLTSCFFLMSGRIKAPMMSLFGDFARKRGIACLQVTVPHRMVQSHSN